MRAYLAVVVVNGTPILVRHTTKMVPRICTDEQDSGRSSYFGECLPRPSDCYLHTLFMKMCGGIAGVCASGNLVVRRWASNILVITGYLPIDRFLSPRFKLIHPSTLSWRSLWNYSMAMWRRASTFVVSILGLLEIGHWAIMLAGDVKLLFKDSTR